MDINLILVAILAILAVLDLTVGVSNDAVNFLNSAQGSKAASMKTILWVASAGIIVGTTMSSGMMEVARKGVFDPGFFTFTAIMWIFLAVMFTDVLLLDIFNSYGLPTSTTVSLVFGLLGAGTTVGLAVAYSRGMTFENLPEIIDFSSTSNIVFSIFSSVFIAFGGGLLVQYISRLAFTFHLEKTLAKVGGVFSGLVGTFIVYFLLVKGAEGTSFVSEEQIHWIENHSMQINTVVFLLLSVISQLLIAMKVNPLRFIVLLGTFSLAMAFAGNDLVNFIGVGIGGYLAYTNLVASGANPDTYLMGELAEKVQSPTVILLAAGVVMIITLWYSAKARKVSETEINLSRQEEGIENFTSNVLSRGLVGATLAVSKSFSGFGSDRVRSLIEGRFEKPEQVDLNEDKAFDLVRASVNLLVSSVLIAYATSLKLPLSTTYVTFMVAMGSSLSDRAWGRDSAVYRISGVLTVIGGWIVTAGIAFLAASLIGLFLYFTGSTGAIALALMTGVIMVKSHTSFLRTRKEEAELENLFTMDSVQSNAYTESLKLVSSSLVESRKVLALGMRALVGQNKDILGRLTKDAEKHTLDHSKLELRMTKAIRKMNPDRADIGYYSLVLFDLMGDLHQSTESFISAIRYHVNNHHPLPSRVFIDRMLFLNKRVDGYFHLVLECIESEALMVAPEVLKEKRALVANLNDLLREQIASLQREEMGSRLGHLQIKILFEIRDAVAVSYRLVDNLKKFRELK